MNTFYKTLITGIVAGSLAIGLSGCKSNKKISEISKECINPMYTLVIDKGGLNPQEGVGIGLIKNKDTIDMVTNYIGMISFNASPKDTVHIYPTLKSGNFNSIDYILPDNRFNVIKVDESIYGQK